ncbi:MAG: sigma-54-dependent Fis family transcriptional regulator [Oligoflexia bacterium]|nr:sigma-54-dependent Fis family transcriptional regulator [Oligoflexia bacterium]
MSITIEDLFRVEGTILLTGETGSGKSFWAKKIHDNSKFKDKKFLNLNLATLSDELIVSELFGHVRGAFTGAHSQKRGLVETVEGGTLFLDEIGELSLSAQKRLLMLLDEEKYSPVGSEEVKNFRGRVIAATNRNIQKMVENGNFREDLYHRLNVFSFFIDPIREDKNRLIEMLNYYFFQYKKKFHKDTFLQMGDECYQALINYYWPGNIREIKNVMEYITSLTNSSEIKKEDLPSYILSKVIVKKDISLKNECQSHSEEHPIEYCQALEKFESSYFSYILDRFNGRINYTADRIKISKATLISKAKKYGINTMLLRAKSRC